LEVWALAEDIMQSVKEKYNIQLEPEVNQISIAKS
jgi:UDP-N-acetylenolpyruvoylglucosamine reductase